MKRSFTFLFFLFSLGLQAQTGYSVGKDDNNLLKVPKFFFGISPLSVEYGPGISPRPSAHLKYRSDYFGEIQLTATYTPEQLVETPASPFGSKLRTNAASNNFTLYQGGEGSYTFYFLKQDVKRNYRVRLAWPSINFEEGVNFSSGEVERITGRLKKFYGFRVGGSYQKGSVYLLNTERTLGYTGFEQTVAFAGLSYTRIGRMYRNFDSEGIKGKNIHLQVYADAFYAVDQRFSTLKTELYKTAVDEAVPYGFRVGISSYKFGFKSRFAIYTNLEGGIRPTFDNLMNGMYVGVKVGIGFGAGKAAVFYISNGKGGSTEGAKENLDGRGKYQRRTPLGIMLHGGSKYKRVKHRFSK